MTGTLLIIAAGPLQVPAIQEATALGLKTVAVDANRLAPGMGIADARYVVDILDAAAVEHVARVERVSGVMTLCTDAPVRTVAAVAAALDLSALSPEAATNATDKRFMRKALKAHGAAIPRFLEVDTLEAALAAAVEVGYPLALKVARSSGSRGVYRVNTQDELARCFLQARKYQPHDNLLLEEWMTGAEVSVEGACCDKQVHVVQVTDKLLFPGTFPVEAGHTQPSRLPAATVAQIRATTETGVRALGLTDCAFHAELKITDDGPKIVEIGARLGGDRIATHLTPLSTGVNMVRAAIQIAMGETPDLAPRFTRGAAIRYFHAQVSGTVESIEGLNELSSLPGLELLFAASERDGLLRSGFVVREIHSSLDRYGYVLFSGEDAEEATARADHAASLVKFHFKPSS